jgi:hypothetical protein
MKTQASTIARLIEATRPYWLRKQDREDHAQTVRLLAWEAELEHDPTRAPLDAWVWTYVVWRLPEHAQAFGGVQRSQLRALRRMELTSEAAEVVAGEMWHGLCVGPMQERAVMAREFARSLPESEWTVLQLRSRHGQMQVAFTLGWSRRWVAALEQRTSERLRLVA